MLECDRVFDQVYALFLYCESCNVEVFGCLTALGAIPSTCGSARMTQLAGGRAAAGAAVARLADIHLTTLLAFDDQMK